MGQLVDIPGVGQVAFPDGMSDVDITKAIRTQIMPRYAQEGGGVSDGGPVAPQAPPRGDTINPVNMPRDEAAGYATTRIRNALTGIAGIPRAASDLVHYGASKLGLSPEDIHMALRVANPVVQAAPTAFPSSQEMNRGIEKATGIQPVNGNPIVDAGIEAGLAGPMMGGGIGSVVPSVASGASSETAGRAVAGSPWEPLVRLFAGALGGYGGAKAQAGVENVLQGVKNVLPPSAEGSGFRPSLDEVAGKVITKNALRDKTTVDAIEANRPEGGMLVEGAGPNVQGALRGSVAAPGEGRANALQNVMGRVEGSDTRTVNALNKGISPEGSLASTVEDLTAQRAAAAKPAYQAAGVPDNPQMVKFAIDQPPGPNSPIINSPKIDALIRDSKDVQDAIANARRLPAFKDMPVNSMAMLDQIYKHVGGLETTAVRQGNGTVANQIGNIRNQLKDAITEVNPKYGQALAEFAGPSATIDAATRGREWFSKNVDPAVVKNEFAALSPGDQQAALIGVRDWARTNIGSPGPSLAANKVRLSGDNLARMQAILPPDAFNTLVSELGIEKNLGATMNRTGLNAGSRTTPMALEAADNASLANAGGVIGDLAHGRPVSAIGRLAGNAFSRLTEGRTEAVNARIADLLTSTDPAKVGMVRALAARAELERIVGQQGRSNALAYGAGVVPLTRPQNVLNSGQTQ